MALSNREPILANRCTENQTDPGKGPDQNSGAESKPMCCKSINRGKEPHQQSGAESNLHTENETNAGKKSHQQS